MAMDTRGGRMAASMMASGKGIRLMASGNSFMLMEIFMMASGLMIRLMVMELIPMLMGLLMLGNGLKINNMERDLKNGLMVPNMKDITWMGKNMVMDV